MITYVIGLVYCWGVMADYKGIMRPRSEVFDEPWASKDHVCEWSVTVCTTNVWSMCGPSLCGPSLCGPSLTPSPAADRAVRRPHDGHLHAELAAPAQVPGARHLRLRAVWRRAGAHGVRSIRPAVGSHLRVRRLSLAGSSPAAELRRRDQILDDDWR